MNILGAYGFAGQQQSKKTEKAKTLPDGLMSQEDRVMEQKEQSFGMSHSVTELQEKKNYKIQTFDGRELLT